MTRKKTIQISYRPRPEQVEIHHALDKYRWSVIVAHRRLGKSVCVINHLIKEAVQCKKPRPRYGYIAPQYNQAKTIAWDYLKHYTQPLPNMKVNESELSVTFFNGAKIRLFGADNPDNLRGQYFDGAVMDEVAQMKPEVWGEVVAPALIDRQGWVCFIGCVAGDTRILTSKGFKRIGDLKSDKYEPKDLDYCDHDLYGRYNEFHNADGFFHNGVCDVKKITTTKGYSVTGSHPHPVLCMSSHGVPEWRKTEDIKLGDKVAISRGMEVWPEVDPLLNFSLTDFREKEAVRKGKRIKYINAPTKMTEDIAYFCGLWIAEGSVEKDIFRLSLTCGDAELINQYLVDGFLGVTPAISRHDQIRFNSKELLEVFKHLGMPLVKAPDKGIPGWVFNGKREWAMAFLSGMIDGDGSIHKNRSTLSYVSASENLIDDIHTLLLNIGVIAYKYKVLTEPSGLIKVSSIGYRLEIGGISLFNLRESLSLRCLHKNNTLQSYVESKHNDIIPFQYYLMQNVYDNRSQHFIPKKGLTYPVTTLLASCRKKGNISYRKLQTFLFQMKGLVKKEGMIYYNTLQDNINDGYFWDKIKTIEDDRVETFDFTVPDTHSFWSNGFMSHNTPKGINLFSELYFSGLRKEKWFCKVFSTETTTVLSKEDLEAARENMTDSQYRQELLCDWGASSDDILIPLDIVNKSRTANNPPAIWSWAPITIGVDVARFGDDSSVIYVRQGLHTIDVQVFKDMDLMTFAEKVALAIQLHKPIRTFVDAVGIGAGLVDRLRQMQFKVIEVNAGASPTSPKYKNKRAECWDEMKKWLVAGGDIPDRPSLMADLTSLTYSFDSADRMVLEKKSDARKRGIPSPNESDALAYTFAFPTPLAERQKRRTREEIDWMNITGNSEYQNAVNMEG